MKPINMSIVVCLMNLNVAAQTDSLKHNLPENTTYTLAAIYGSNVSYYGQVTDKKLPYLIGNLTVQFPFGLYTSSSLYKLLTIGSGLSGTDISAGFSFDPSNRLNIDLSYTRSFFPSTSPLLQAANKNTITLTTEQQWSWFQSSFVADFAFGSDKDLFLSLENSKRIQLGSIYSSKDMITIEPSIEIVAGSQHFYRTYIEKKHQGNPNGNGKNPSLPPNSSAPSTTSLVGSTEFRLLSYNFKLPLYYYRTNYMIEAGYQLSLIDKNVETTVQRRQSFIRIGLYYQF